MLTAAMHKKRRRLISSDILIVSIGESPWFYGGGDKFHA